MVFQLLSLYIYTKKKSSWITLLPLIFFKTPIFQSFHTNNFHLKKNPPVFFFFFMAVIFDLCALDFCEFFINMTLMSFLLTFWAVHNQLGHLVSFFYISFSLCPLRNYRFLVRVVENYCFRPVDVWDLNIWVIWVVLFGSVQLFGS